MIRDFCDADRADFLAWNTRFVHWLSPLDAAGLDDILARATYCRSAVAPQTGRVQGVLIAYADDVDYTDHQNMAWLRRRLDRFLYIDRIVIAPDAQGQGVGQRLYDDLARLAKGAGHTTLACEVNTRPDNPGSHRFHLRAGFAPLGDRASTETHKAVRYYAKQL